MCDKYIYQVLGSKSRDAKDGFLSLHHIHDRFLCNSYTMCCPPVRGDNLRALASGLSYVQVDKHGITILYTYISVDLAHHEIFRAKVGKGGIKPDKKYKTISFSVAFNRIVA